ncbi:lipopolysaccharide assembly protein LapA domain-containing protein [Endozoicomonas sp. 8E]|uniref:lipopolysaccharide assembly protein LapA domain-containing protein n=1 Tax=Endozoicomonas sp. 8E TaxID=3035692 RepID=UPI002938EDF1|nr:lipopolysaccharide assembly protein LapA domain-containing protein [Endozoicomonas sp. 8E]WOG30196.1 lipopolysaccharide assembly protein LapA domain-containing protein [Endozoicomonas sp. 8E]
MVSHLSIWLKRLVILLGSLLLLIILVNFIVANPQLVRFDLAGFLLPEVKVSSVVVISFIMGGLFGLLVSLLAMTRLRLANASFKRKLGRRDAEIQKLRANALQGLT